MRSILIELSLASLSLATLVPILGAAPPPTSSAQAIFAGGCFWCLQPPFEKLPGVIRTEAGYIGGSGTDPTYDDYAEKGYLEAIRVTYDPTKVTYAQLLETFWRQIDPTDAGGQFVDRGPQYRTAIFYLNPDQKAQAERSKAELGRSGRYKEPIVTELIAATYFYPAEDYHQDFYKKSPVRYKAYRAGAGRDTYLEKVWGHDTPTTSAAKTADLFKKPTAEELKKKLTPMQFDVTQHAGTEPPFKNAFWNEHRPGLYVDIVSGKPLFSSLDKFDSGCGWPSFTRPLVADAVRETTDTSHGMTRTEIRSTAADSHLGHVFEDGPAPTGLRYCINSAALRFIPKDDLEKEGYGEYRKLFEK